MDNIAGRDSDNRPGVEDMVAGSELPIADRAVGVDDGVLKAGVDTVLLIEDIVFTFFYSTYSGGRTVLLGGLS